MPLCKITTTTVLAFFSNLQTLDSALHVSQIWVSITASIPEVTPRF
jgi:hypothetical protein